MKICSIIVTYNRKDLLLRCLSAVFNQTQPVSSLLIVDNASTDGTWKAIKEKYSLLKDYITDVPSVVGEYENVELIYLRNSVNRGGAGGFSLGLRRAHEMRRYESFWMMDDDGYPSENCLEQLLPYLSETDYVMPVSMDLEHPGYLSWPSKLRKGGKTIQYKMLKKSWGKVMNFIYPFNGSLLSEKIVDEVGYINEKLFLWGDEYEHYWRCRKKGYQPVTVIDAIFYHPSDKMFFMSICFGLFKVPYSESDLRMICLARNYTHIYWHYGCKCKIVFKLILYTWFFLFTRKGDVRGYKLYLLSVMDGLRGDFTRHLAYLNCM